MTTRTVILARHGETELNRLGVVQGSGVDPSLNAEGTAQARALAAVFEQPFDLYLTSGMTRASETLAAFEPDPTLVEVDDRFREICWGVHEGKVATPQSRQAYKDLLEAWQSGDYDAAFPAAESARELADRLLAGWDDLTSRNFERALVVMHGRALRCLTCLIDGQPLSQMDKYGHRNAGYYVVELTDDGWNITARNVTDHLAAAAATSAL